MNYDIDRLRSIQLEILSDLGQLLDANGIRYYLIGGNALGAIRHGGFIPWDDDIDIAIFKEDEKNFLKICRAQLGDGYFIQSCRNQKEYVRSFYKIRKNGTACVEEKNRGLLNMHHGVFIDVYVLYGVPKHRLLRSIMRRMIWLNNMMSYNRSPKLDGVKGYFKRILLPVRFPIKNFTKFIIDLINTLFRLKNSKYISNIFGTVPFEKSIIPRDYFGQPKYLEYEGKKLPFPSKIERYLEAIFGSNYMEPPPEDQRISHNYYLVDFNRTYQEVIKDGEQ